MQEFTTSFDLEGLENLDKTATNDTTVETAPPPPPPPPAMTAATPPSTVDPLLVKILTSQRGYGSDGELQFMTWLRQELASRGFRHPTVFTGGSIAVTVPREDGKKSTVLFSCHTDTCHSTWADKNNSFKQQICYDATLGVIYLDKESKSNCLGADDGAGVWMLLQMIDRKVPGTYLFHRGEERGCIGAGQIRQHHKNFLEQFDVAVAFDRGGRTDVITHMGGLRVCSDKFAEALSAALNARSKLFKYEPCDRGMLTDTKIYRDVISECTNISVGYECNHSKEECVSYLHLKELLEVVCAIDWEALPVDRDPKSVEYDFRGYSRGRKGIGYGSFGASTYGSLFDDSDDRYLDTNVQWPTSSGKKAKKGKKAAASPAPAPAPAPVDDRVLLSVEELADAGIDDVAVWVEQFDSRELAASFIKLASEIEALRAQVRFLQGALR